MRISFDTERLKTMGAAVLPDGADVAKWVKRNTLGRVARAYDSMDPQVAEHLLSAQRSFFLAGKAFFEEELRHADRALDKVRARAAKAAGPPPAATAEQAVAGAESSPPSEVN
jgi:hypothetical protein